MVPGISLMLQFAINTAQLFAPLLQRKYSNIDFFICASVNELVGL
jgi:hypothetical protein